MPTLEVVLGYEVVPVNITVGKIDSALLFGYSIKETTGSNSAELDILNGQSAAGDLVMPITLSAGQSTEDWFGPQGIMIRGGIYLNTVSGSVAGSIFIAYDWSGS